MIVFHVITIIIISFLLVRYGKNINVFFIRIFTKTNRRISKFNNKMRIAHMRKIEDSIEKKHKKKKSHHSVSSKLEV